MIERAFLYKITGAQKKIIGWLGLILAGSIMQACDTQLPIGLDFVETEPLHVFNLDTVTVKFSTVYLDSIATNNSGRLLAGYHQDSLTGSLEATSYFLVKRDSLVTPDKEYASYQEAAFRLYYDGYWYYDTTQIITLSLYLLNETLEANDGTGGLYNSSSFSYDPVGGLLGKISFLPRPGMEYVEFPIDYEFGDSLFQAIVNEEDYITDDDDFVEKYKGFVLIPDKVQGTVLGFSNSSSLVLKYIEGGKEEELILSVEDELHFNQVTGDLSGSLLASLTDSKKNLPSEETNDMAIMQGGYPYGIRIEFPHLHNLLQLSRDIYISQAYMIISPVYDTSMQYEPYPSSFSIYSVDKLNRQYGQLDISPGFYLDKEYKEETYYSFPVADYLNDLLSMNEDRGDALILTIPGSTINKSVTRLKIGDSTNKYKSELRILILTLDQAEY